MEGIRWKLVLVVTLALIALTFIPLESYDADDQSDAIEVVDSQGRSIEGSTALIKKQLVFETYTVNGQTTFFLEKGTDITVPDRYLRITGSAGAFTLSAAIPGSSINGSLKDTGLIIRLTSEDDVLEATLTQDDEFTDDFTHSGNVAGIQPGKLYRINILTAEDISGSSSVEETMPFTIVFYADGAYVVYFYDGTELIESIAVAPGGTISDLPVLEDTDEYQFVGWYDNKDVIFTEHTPVYSNITLHAKWQRISPDPGEDIIERYTEVIKNDDGTYTVKDTEIVIHPDGSTDETVTSTTDNKDGSVTVNVDEVATDSGGREKTVECTVVTKTNDDGTESSE